MSHLRGLPGVTKVEVNLMSGQARVEHDPGVSTWPKGEQLARARPRGERLAVLDVSLIHVTGIPVSEGPSIDDFVLS